jgi:hypothetical protein
LYLGFLCCTFCATFLSAGIATSTSTPVFIIIIITTTTTTTTTSWVHENMACSDYAMGCTCAESWFDARRGKIIFSVLLSFQTGCGPT